MSIGTGYDLSSSTFSPDGRVFQVRALHCEWSAGGRAGGGGGRLAAGASPPPPPSSSPRLAGNKPSNAMESRGRRWRAGSSPPPRASLCSLARARSLCVCWRLSQRADCGAVETDVGWARVLLCRLSMPSSLWTTAGACCLAFTQPNSSLAPPSARPLCRRRHRRAAHAVALCGSHRSAAANAARWWA